MYKYLIAISLVIVTAACTEAPTDGIMPIVWGRSIHGESRFEVVDYKQNFGFHLDIVKKTVDGDLHLFLIKDGEEKFIRSINENFDREPEAESLVDAYTTSDDKYLIYEVGGWEWMKVYVYDIAAEKEVYNNWGRNYGFTDDGRYFYQCLGVSHFEGYMQIYSLPDFSLYEDLTEGSVVNCFDYNPSDNSIQYEVSYDNYYTGVVKTYYFD